MEIIKINVYNNNKGKLQFVENRHSFSTKIANKTGEKIDGS